MTEQDTNEIAISALSQIANHNKPTPEQVWLSIFCAALSHPKGDCRYAESCAEIGVTKYLKRFPNEQ